MLHVINRFVYVQKERTLEPTFTATVQSTCEPTWKHVQQGTSRDRAEIVQTKPICHDNTQRKRRRYERMRGYRVSLGSEIYGGVTAVDAGPGRLAPVLGHDVERVVVDASSAARGTEHPGARGQNVKLVVRVKRDV